MLISELCLYVKALFPQKSSSLVWIPFLILKFRCSKNLTKMKSCHCLEFPPDSDAFIIGSIFRINEAFSFGILRIYLYIGITSCDYKITHP